MPYTSDEDVNSEATNIHNSTSIFSEHTTNSDLLELDTRSVEDMEIDHDVSSNVPLEKSCNSECGLSIQHKPRISGPRSKTNLYTKVTKTEEVVYQPQDLIQLVVQCINGQNMPDFEFNFSTREVRISESLSYCCRYCEKIFEDETELAVHELDIHIQLHLPRVDKGSAWSDSQDEFETRNLWMAAQEAPATDSTSMTEVNGDDGKDLLVPIVEEKVEVKEEAPELDSSRNSIVYFVGQVPYANGQLLKSIPKEVRNTYYQSVIFCGARKKFCQLCRYTFKDNWSMDNHYFLATCCQSCHYCGMKFHKRNKHELPGHVNAHELAGHTKSLSVFATNDRGDIVEYDTSCLKTYVPLLAHAYYSRAPKPPPPKPTPMKLRVRQILPTPAPVLDNPPPPSRQSLPPRESYSNEAIRSASPDVVKNQAYFCKKCYQVFTKLSNYNSHIVSCNGVTEPELSVIRPYSNNFAPPALSSKVRSNTKKMPALKPLPPPVKIKQENGITEAPVEDFPCNFCSAVFKTVYSRNSHMRIHVRNKPSAGGAQQNAQKRPAAPPIVPPKKIKQESFEPIVEIHEGATTTIGSVSITPLKRVMSGRVNPDVLKLVENNPNITFKPRTSNPTPPRQTSQFERAKNPVITPMPSPQPIDESDSAKGYKCASCFQQFGNKSNLYFHKKNQCTGSRFPCPFCKKRFGTASEYSSHIFYSHPE